MFMQSHKMSFICIYCISQVASKLTFLVILLFEMGSWCVPWRATSLGACLPVVPMIFSGGPVIGGPFWVIWIINICNGDVLGFCWLFCAGRCGQWWCISRAYCSIFGLLMYGVDSSILVTSDAHCQLWVVVRLHLWCYALLPFAM